MKFYTKTGSSHGYFEGRYFNHLKFAKCQPESIYWYDCHDYVVRQLEIKDCLEEIHWNHLLEDPTSKFMIFHPDEYFNYSDVKMWVDTLKKRRVPTSQVYFVVEDENWVEWFNRIMEKFDYRGYNICSLPLLMWVVRPQEKQSITGRFSILSRNYQKWRLDFFLKLLEKDLLKDMTYTFNNLCPYGDNMPIFPHEELIANAEELGFTINEKILNWIKHVPYTFDNVRITDKFSNVVYDTISSHGINVVVESQCDPHYFFGGHRHIDSKTFSVAFPTEKTFKAIACSRPFIILSSQYFLQEFKQLGFKTFHPYIDESYDNCYNMQDRFNAIVNELDRLRNLSDKEFQDLLEVLQPIADYNLEVMKERQSHVKLTGNFEFLNQYLDKHFLFNR